MRTASKLLLLCAAVLAAMAIGATNASATGGIEVVEEATGNPCNPCTVHATGESELHNEDGTRFSTCEDEFTASVGHAGTGSITLVENQNHAGFSCVTQACTGNPEGESGAWPILHSEETAANEGEMEVRYCIEHASFPNFTGEHCTVPVHVAEESTDNHHYTYSVNGFHCPSRIVTGTWETEAPHDAIEINHTG